MAMLSQREGRVRSGRRYGRKPFWDGDGGASRWITGPSGIVMSRCANRTGLTHGDQGASSGARGGRSQRYASLGSLR